MDHKTASANHIMVEPEPLSSNNDVSEVASEPDQDPKIADRVTLRSDLGITIHPRSHELIKADVEIEIPMDCHGYIEPYIGKKAEINDKKNKTSKAL